MTKLYHTSQLRLVAIVFMLTITIVVSAQAKRDITAAINHGGKITVIVPQGITERNNDDLSGNKAAKSTKKTDDDNNDGDENVEKKPERPRTNTTHQTVQGRSTGYRIQVYNDNSGSKAEAQNRARTIAMKYPQYRTYISYNAPTWRLRIGDFKNQGEAQEAIKRLRATFPQYARQMVVVRDNVNVWNN